MAVYIDGISQDLLKSDVDDTPVDAATDVPPSSNWAYDHGVATTGVHGVGAGTVAKVADIAATKLDDFATPDDNTDLNATTSVHGLLKKLDNTATNFMDGQGNWSAPAGGATKEFFVPVTVGSDPISGVFPFWQLDAAAEKATMGFFVPNDFSSITEAVVIRVAKATATHRLNYAAYYGAQGETYVTHTDTLLDQDTAETNQVIYEQDISAMLSNLAAGDYVGVEVTGDATNTPDDYIIGVRFKYA